MSSGGWQIYRSEGGVQKNVIGGVDKFIDPRGGSKKMSSGGGSIFEFWGGSQKSWKKAKNANSSNLRKFAKKRVLAKKCVFRQCHFFDFFWTSLKNFVPNRVHQKICKKKCKKSVFSDPFFCSFFQKTKSQKSRSVSAGQPQKKRERGGVI